MTTPRDLLSVKLAAARKRRDDAARRVAIEDGLIEDLLAKKRALFTRQLRRTAHWPKRQSRAEREIETLIAQEVSL
jgi:hypothetical protein